jgi:hypothetical protein
MEIQLQFLQSDQDHRQNRHQQNLLLYQQQNHHLIHLQVL